MNIFESLENLQVSESCFNSIIELVEEFINEKVTKDDKEKVLKARKDREEKLSKRYSNIKNARYIDPYSYTGDEQLDAVVDWKRAERKRENCEKVIDKHNKAQEEGKVPYKD